MVTETRSFSSRRFQPGFLKKSISRIGIALAMPAIILSSLTAPAFADQTLDTVTVTAKRLDLARNGIQTQLGASSYNITSHDIQAQPGGENQLLNQVVLQAPGVVQDSFGQFHVRGEHNAIQYRLNGIILPEGISVFGQTLDPRLAASMQLITGALPAEYGLVTGGIIDMKTRTGLFEPGGHIGIYGGSHNEIQPSFGYGGSAGSFNYFVSGDYLSNSLGIESPDGSSNPIHDNTRQFHGFAYLQDIIDPSSSITAVLGTSDDHFQIPNTPGLTPDLGLTVNGQTSYPSARLNETQHEATHYGILSYLHSKGSLNYQISVFGRYSSLRFSPDPVGDLLYDGIAQQAFKDDIAYGVQAEGAYHLGSRHTIRGGFLFQNDRATSRTTSSVLPAACTGSGTFTTPFECAPLASSNPAYDVPISIVDNGAKTETTYSVYIQDEWRILDSLTLNYGLRFDTYKGYSSESQVSPRVNLVWLPVNGTTVHVGYARYFTPPPFELIASKSVVKFLNTSASPVITQDRVSKAERANYLDAGINQQITGALTVGVDSYYKVSDNLIDEGQFGAPIILTPFNYRNGKQYGLEFTGSYRTDTFSGYANVALARAEGRGIISSQFAFNPGDLAYIADHYIHLDHEQFLTMSGGVSYNWDGTILSADLLYGSGLRKDGAVPNGLHVPGYTQVNLGISHHFKLDGWGGLTARIDVINLFDEKYQIRDGTGVGVGAPQWGPRRGVFFGVSKAL